MLYYATGMLNDHNAPWQMPCESNMKYYVACIAETVRDSKVHGANTGPTWVLSAPGGPHIGPMNLAIRGLMQSQGMQPMTAELSNINCKTVWDSILLPSNSAFITAKWHQGQRLFHNSEAWTRTPQTGVTSLIRLAPQTMNKLHIKQGLPFV